MQPEFVLDSKPKGMQYPKDSSYTVTPVGCGFLPLLFSSHVLQRRPNEQLHEAPLHLPNRPNAALNAGLDFILPSAYMTGCEWHSLINLQSVNVKHN